jgi:ABC-type lipoprotein release transport system permease subunit
VNLRTLLFLAWTDLTKDWRVLSLVILAVGSGSLAIVPLRGLLEGLTRELIATTVDVSSGHVIIVPPEEKPFLRNIPDIRTAAQSLPGVAGLSVRLVDRALVRREDPSVWVAALGVDPVSEAHATSVAAKVTAGRFLEDGGMNELVVGQQVSDQLDLHVGEDAEVAFSNGARQTFRVRGIFSTGLRQIDGQIFLSRRRLSSVLNLEGRASEIVIRLSDIEFTDLFQMRLQRMGIDARVETWRDRLQFVEGMRRNYAFIQNFLVLLTLVAAGIATGVLIYTDIQHKRRTIGILKAIGAKDRGVLALFLVQGLAIGLAGATVGGVLGGGLCYYLSLRPVALGVSASSLPLRASFTMDLLVLPTMLILVTTLLSASYPAWRAAKLAIVEAIWAS